MSDSSNPDSIMGAPSVLQRGDVDANGPEPSAIHGVARESEIASFVRGLYAIAAASRHQMPFGGDWHDLERAARMTERLSAERGKLVAALWDLADAVEAVESLHPSLEAAHEAHDALDRAFGNARTLLSELGEQP